MLVRPCHICLASFAMLTTCLSGQWAWTKNSPSFSPGPRARFGFSYDVGRQQTVLFGGQGQAGLLKDTWEWDGTVWNKLAPVSVPTARAGHAMVYDPVAKRILMFGGVTTAGIDAQTWDFDGISWRRLNPAQSPPARHDQVMVWDSVRQRVLLYGGQSGSRAFDDMWEWDGSVWSQRSPSARPFPRLGTALAFDSKRGRAVLFGGFNGADLADTWEWDGSRWWQMNTLGTPVSRQSHVMTFDPVRGRVVLFGGTNRLGARFEDTWEWDGRRWIQDVLPLSPRGRINFGLLHDTARSRTFLFGGEGKGLLADGWNGFGSKAAGYSLLGVGCKGSSGTPQLYCTKYPKLGQPFEFRVVGMTAARSGVILAGLTDLLWKTVTLPLDLSPLGASACHLFISIDAELGFTADATGATTFNVRLPNDQTLLGLHFFNQAFVLSPGSNALGLITSNAGRAFIGQ